MLVKMHAGFVIGLMAGIFLGVIIGHYIVLVAVTLPIE
jgi:ABC-type nitrate/sulfonate/bicarbonate transport system permease component